MPIGFRKLVQEVGSAGILAAGSSREKDKFLRYPSSQNSKGSQSGIEPSGIVLSCRILPRSHSRGFPSHSSTIWSHWEPSGHSPLRTTSIGAIGALMNRVRQPHTLLVLGLNAEMGTTSRRTNRVRHTRA